MNTKTRHWASITAGILSLAGSASAASLGSEKYTYDASGNIIEKSIDGKIIKMNYDPSNRLIERQTTGENKETTAYDAAGRPIAMREATEQPSRSMSYGYGDKVLETTRKATNIGFCYNAEGHLVGKSVGGKTIPYAWDGNVLAAEGAEAFINEAHVTGGVPVVAGDQEIIVSDYLGSTLAQGYAQFTSTAFGEGLEAGRFTGKPFVEGLESYVFANRFYSPDLNRWTTSDPSGFPEDANNFVYVVNDPCNAVDPEGLCSLNCPQSKTQGVTVVVTGSYPSGTATCTVTSTAKYTSSLSGKTIVGPTAFIVGTPTSYKTPTAKIDNAIRATLNTSGHSSCVQWHSIEYSATATYDYGASNPANLTGTSIGGLDVVGIEY